MDDGSRRLVLGFTITNAIMTIADTSTQILHYFLTTWATEEAKDIALMFLIFRPVTLFLMFFIYTIFHYEKIITCGKKLITFALFLCCMYIGYSPGVHLSFYSKFYLDSENGIVICKVVNAFTFIFVSLPKLLIIPINSSAHNSWEVIDIIALIISSLFLIWCIIYYVMCGLRDFDFEIELEDMSRVWEIVENNEDNYKNNSNQENNLNKSNNKSNAQETKKNDPYINKDIIKRVSTEQIREDNNNQDALKNNDLKEEDIRIKIGTNEQNIEIQDNSTNNQNHKSADKIENKPQNQ